MEGQLLRVHIIRDITERRKNEEKINHLAHYDILTGLENRASIMERLEEVFTEATNQNLGFAVMVIDLDKFKMINDTYGHLVGDEVLIQAAQRFRRALRKGDNIGRYGGDEFLLIQQGITGKADIPALVERIFSEFEQPWAVEGFELSVHISVGISVYPMDGENQEDLIRQADRAMYAAKKINGNAFVWAEHLE